MFRYNPIFNFCLHLNGFTSCRILKKAVCYKKLSRNIPFVQNSCKCYFCAQNLLQPNSSDSVEISPFYAIIFQNFVEEGTASFLWQLSPLDLAKTSSKDGGQQHLHSFRGISPQTLKAHGQMVLVEWVRWRRCTDVTGLLLFGLLFQLSRATHHQQGEHGSQNYEEDRAHRDVDVHGEKIWKMKFRKMLF